MKALLLAAGTASRLRPLTDSTPKCLLDIGGKSILERAVDNLRINGIVSFVVVTGYLGHMIRDVLGKRYPDLEIEYVHNDVYASTNNIYSLWLAREVMLGHGMLLLDSDILFAPETIASLLASPHENCLALKVTAVGDEEIKVRLDSDSRVHAISKVIPIDQTAGESIGIERFSTGWVSSMYSVLERMINVDRRVGVFYEAAFEEMILLGHPLHAVDVTAWPCMELDTVADVEHARTVLLSQLR